MYTPLSLRSARQKRLTRVVVRKVSSHPVHRREAADAHKVFPLEGLDRLKACTRPNNMLLCTIDTLSCQGQPAGTHTSTGLVAAWYSIPVFNRIWPFLVLYPTSLL